MSPKKLNQFLTYLHRIKIICVLILFVAFTSSCARKRFERNLATATTVEKGAIPPDFGKTNFTLLYIEFGREKIDKIATEILKAEYHGNYEVITRQEYKNDSVKYNDPVKYAYVFSISSSIKTKYYGTHNESTSFLYVYYLLDGQMENKTYRCPSQLNWYEHIVKVYIQQLEKQRRKNSAGIY